MEIEIWNPSLTLKSQVCLDTGCAMSAIDVTFLKRFAPELKIGLSPEPITIKGIGGTPHLSREYVVFSLKIPSATGDCAVLAEREFHLVSHLGCCVLIGTDILKPEKFIINLGMDQIMLPLCGNLVVPCRVSPLERPKERRIVTSSQSTVIPPFSVKGVGVHIGRNHDSKKTGDYEFCFGLNPASAHLSLYGEMPSCIVDGDTTSIPFVNFSERPVRINKGLRLGEATKISLNDPLNGAEIDANSGFFGNLQWWLSPEFEVKDVDSTSVKIRFPTTVQCKHSETAQKTEVDPCSADAVDINPELDSKQIDELRNLLREFPKIWENRVGEVIEPEEDWLEIKLKPGALDALKSRGPYRLSDRDKKVVDDWFDPLVKNGQMTSGVKSPIASPVFVVWRNGKGRAVVDMRGINKWTVPDAYPLPLQDDILLFVSGKRFISIFDLVKSFYQRLVKTNDQWKTAVASHRGLEWFNVAPMGCLLSPGHMQRFMDKLLELYKEFARCYIDDVTIASCTFKLHLKHLRQFLELIKKVNITLSAPKAHVGYTEIKSLGHKVDRFGISSVEEKVSAIKNIRFPTNLSDLEKFIGLIGWFRRFIPGFALVVSPLQALKTKLLRPFVKEGDTTTKARKVYAKTMRIESPTFEELEAFNKVKELLCSERSLIHDNPELPLIISVDASHARGYAVTVRQVPAKTMAANKLTEDDIIEGRYDRRLEKRILELSRESTPAERKYWPTEMETACVCWAIQKLRHLIEAGNRRVVIHTDHSATRDIAVSTKLKSSSTTRVNQKLIRAGQYLSQFPNIVWKYKKGKENTDADALSRLQVEDGTGASGLDQDFEQLGPDLVGYLGTYVNLTDNAVKAISEGYAQDVSYRKIFPLLEGRLEGDCELAEYNGFLAKKHLGRILLFMIDGEDKRLRLCIPSSATDAICKLAHDMQNHAGIVRMKDTIRQNYYIKGMSKIVEAYRKKCVSGEVNTNQRHMPFGELQPIACPPTIFHTLNMDMIVKLPVTKAGFDSILTVVDRFSKAIRLLPGRENYSAIEWAEVFFAQVYTKWGLPKAIITDRGSQFGNRFWKALFDKLNCSLLTTTAYHPQGDGAAERANQTVEIALRHIVNPRQDDWDVHLPMVEFVHNNSMNASTLKSPNEIIYGHKLRDPLEAISDTLVAVPTAQKSLEERKINQKEVLDAIQFAQAKSALYYDSNHQRPQFVVGESAYINVNRKIGQPSYRVAVNSRSLGPQRVGPYRILRQVGRMAFELELPPSLQIHPVVSVAHLEKGPASVPVGPPPDIVYDEGNNGEGEFEVEAILAAEMRGRGRNRQLHYLVKWVGYGHDQNKWLPRSPMEGSRQLIEEWHARNPIINGATEENGPNIATRSRRRLI